MGSQFGISEVTTIVTGASSGIGRTIAERFAADGASVMVCSREQDRVDPVAAEIRADGGDCLALECDVTDRGAVERLVDTTVEEFGGVDCLINNAGASFMASFDDLTPNGWKTVVEINLDGTYHCSQVASTPLADGGGSVINMASLAGQQGAPYMSHYGAAKAGVINLTETLAFEWADRNVRVNCIAPGFVATQGLADQMGIEAADISRSAVDRRIGLPAEIADIAQFLASDAASFLTGETITPRGVPDIEERPDR